MTPEKTKLLYETFPKLYGGHTLPPTQSLMCFGFEHGDGWFDIIWDLSKELYKLEPIPMVAQVKEKYGTLRFYYDHWSDEADLLVQEAERKSAVTCETCGAAGKLRGTGWLRTECDECHKQRKNGQT